MFSDASDPGPSLPFLFYFILEQPGRGHNEPRTLDFSVRHQPEREKPQLEAHSFYLA